MADNLQSSNSNTSTVATTTATSSHSELVWRSSTLAIITLIAFVANTLLVATIMSSRSLRRVQLNKHIVSLSLNSLLNCIVVMPVTMGFSVTMTWDYGDATCKIFAHILLTLSAALCLTILSMNLDRVIAISNPEMYDRRMTSFSTAVVIFLCWTTAILFPLPISLEITRSEPSQHRYVCSIASGASINYLISFYSICFALPSIANILCFVYIGREALSEREAQSTGTSRAIHISELWPEVKASGVVLAMFVSWLLTELPYISLTSIHQYTGSEQVGGELSYSRQVDTALTWLKFCDTIFLPLVVFKCRKEIWLKFKDLILCRKNNSVLDASPRPDDAADKGRSNHQGPSGNKGTSSNNHGNSTSYNPRSAAPFKIPTLKATKGGLHIQGENEEDEEGSIFYADMDLTGKSGNFHTLFTRAEVEASRQHNIILPHDGGDGDDTSDYETDPYSQSDPISVRSSHNQAGDAIEMRQVMTKANSISMDSGNGSASSSVKKKRKKKRPSSEQSVSSEQAAGSECHTNAAADIDRADDVETNVDDFSDMSPSARHRHRLRHSAFEAADDEPVREPPNSMVSEISEPSKPKKRKKKRKNMAIADAETNTTQVLEFDSERKVAPPARLEPLHPDILSQISTPPLRRKFLPDRDDMTPLPPAGASPQKTRRTKPRDQPSDCGDQTLSEPVAVKTEHQSSHKRRSRPRKASGDSSKNLMSSNTSSEMHSVIGETPLSESQL